MAIISGDSCHTLVYTTSIPRCEKMYFCSDGHIDLFQRIKVMANGRCLPLLLCLCCNKFSWMDIAKRYKWRYDRIAVVF